MATSTQYDRIGNRYKAFKERPVVDIEEPSVLKRLGSIEGLTVLDLACGLGTWSRLFTSLGASTVVGIDISTNMIESARALTPETQGHNLTFEVGDCSTPHIASGGSFDIVFAGWLLNYAPNYKTMARMWQHIYLNLKPGGRFVGITPNTHCPMYEPIDESYGVAVYPVEKVGEGWKCHLISYVESGEAPVEFDMYHFMHDFYERAAAEAGMVEIKWYPAVPPDDERRENGYWDIYFLRPHMNIITASRT